MSERPLSPGAKDLLQQARDSAGHLMLDDGAAVGDAVTSLLTRGLVCLAGAVGDDVLHYQLTPEGWILALKRPVREKTLP